jgi:hypothetical protein
LLLFALDASCRRAFPRERMPHLPKRLARQPAARVGVVIVLTLPNELIVRGNVREVHGVESSLLRSCEISWPLENAHKQKSPDESGLGLFREWWLIARGIALMPKSNSGLRVPHCLHLFTGFLLYFITA